MGPTALWGRIPHWRPRSGAGVPLCRGSGGISAMGRSGSDPSAQRGSRGPTARLEGGRLGRVSAVFVFAY